MYCVRVSMWTVEDSKYSLRNIKEKEVVGNLCAFEKYSKPHKQRLTCNHSWAPWSKNSVYGRNFQKILKKFGPNQVGTHLRELRRPKFRPLGTSSNKMAALLPWRACRECPAGSWRGLPGPRAPCHGGDPAHNQSCVRCPAQTRSHICNDQCKFVKISSLRFTISRRKKTKGLPEFSFRYQYVRLGEILLYRP
jgi:hypothetical protein